MADFNPLTIPAVMPASVARTKQDGKPTQAMLDWEQGSQAWMKDNVASTNTRLNEVSDAIDGVSASVTEETIARVSADEALASQITTLDATLGDVSADLQTEITTRATADTALASSITTVDAKANTATASGAVYLSAKAAPAGATAAYGWYLTSGNAFVGMEAIADSVVGSAVAITADRFYVYAGANRIQAFGHDGTNWFLNGNLIIRSGTSGARQVITSENTKIYDASNVLRVAMGINI